MNKRKLRRKIANRVEDKMGYLATCPNERDIILNMIFSKKDRYPWKQHCTDDCRHFNCEVYKKLHEEKDKQDGS